MRYSQVKDPWYTKKTWAEISKSALINNLRVIRSHIPEPGVVLAPVVKADAYGHCADLVVPVLEEAGVRWLFVATIDEAIALRQGGARSEILIFGTTKSEHVPYLKRYRLTQSVVSAAEVSAFARASEKTGGPPLEVHVKLDTGMTRLGLLTDDRNRDGAVRTMLALLDERSLKVTGVYSHLASPDTDPEYTALQRERFLLTLDAAQRQGFPRVTRHLASSSAIAGQSSFHFDMVRPGIVLYGGKAAPEGEAWRKLRPVMTVKTVIEQVGQVAAGTRVSYGGTYVTDRESFLAVVNMGYGDGLSRQLSNCGAFFSRGRMLPIRGRVCMDRCIVDVTDTPDVAVGDEVLLFGEEGGFRQNASDLAALYGTIDYELFTNINERVPRILVD